MKYLGLLFGLLLGIGRAGAQPVPLARQYAAAIVSLKATQASGTSEKGSGFVVGTTPDSVYIVTAGHVLREAGATVRVRLHGAQPELLGKVLFFANTPAEDLALLAVAAKKFRWPSYSTYTGLTPDDDGLCFIHSPLVEQDNDAPAGEKLLLPLNSEAAMLTANRQAHTLRFMLVGVEPGDSGSALLLAGSPLCVVGMITRTGPPHTAIDIGHIKATLLPRLGSKWQLPALPPKTD